MEEFSAGSFVEVFVRCEHILFELLDEFMPFMSRQKQTADTIVKYITNGTRFQSYSNIDGRFNLQVPRGSKLKCIDELCENVDGIRMCSDLPNEQGMFTIEVSPKRRRDLGIIVHNRKNRKKIKRIVNGNDVITRLFPYGQDGLTIEEANNSGRKEYIDSENINDYLRPKEACVVFESIVEPNNLYELAVEYLNSKKKPSISYEIEIEALRDYIEKPDLLEVGDILTVVDEMIGDGIRTQAMITEITYYPDDKDKNMTVSLEEVILGADKLIADLLDSQETDTGIRKGNVWTEFVTVPFSNQVTTIEFGVAYQTKPVINAQVIGDEIVNTSVS
ncbi:MAG: phage tail spike protein, partial [Culicoidibacterales bacterium]